jgi:hypothetical protein
VSIITIHDDKEEQHDHNQRDSVWEHNDQKIIEERNELLEKHNELEEHMLVLQEQHELDQHDMKDLLSGILMQLQLQSNRKEPGSGVRRVIEKVVS